MRHTGNTVRRRVSTLRMVAVLLLFMAALPAHAQSLFMEDLTWPELRERIAAGSTIAIVPTGGTEQGGPHLALGKHSFVVREAAARIAAELGNALVAPVIPVVPEGPLDHPSGNLQFPGTLALNDETYARLLRDIATSLALSGFKLICFLGDHGQSQAEQEKVAAAMTAALASKGSRVINVSAYYAPDAEDRELVRQGIARNQVGDHAGVADTAVLMAVRPDAVRMGLRAPERWPNKEASGASGRPELATALIGENLLRQRVAAAIWQIRRHSP